MVLPLIVFSILLLPKASYLKDATTGLQVKFEVKVKPLIPTILFLTSHILSFGNPSHPIITVPAVNCILGLGFIVLLIFIQTIFLPYQALTCIRYLVH